MSKTSAILEEGQSMSLCWKIRDKKRRPSEDGLLFSFPSPTGEGFEERN